MTEHPVRLSSKLVAHLYALQALTYAAAAALSWYNGHADLCGCYSFSALIHTGFAACHRQNLE